MASSIPRGFYLSSVVTRYTVTAGWTENEDSSKASSRIRITDLGGGAGGHDPLKGSVPYSKR